MLRVTLPLPVIFGLAALAAAGAGCDGGTSAPPGPTLTRDQLEDPEVCGSCHPDHYREWSGSMHAYAAEDPVFLAMNARGQRETGGALGAFCIQCHAPMAVRNGATTDGLNLADVPQKWKGVTCYFCHSVTEVDGSHNNPLALADDGVLRGGIVDPVETAAHTSAYSPLHDRTAMESSSLCGSCHDIVTPAGVHLERTYLEWQETLFAKEQSRLTCGECHMEGRDGAAAEAPGAKTRRVHSHAAPGVDLALTPFPESEAQRELVQRSLDTTLAAQLCVRGAGSPGATILAVLDNVGAGHNWPSGAAQDRRAWVEIIAYSGDVPVYQSGVVGEGESVSDLADPDLWWARDCLLDAEGAHVHMFWEAAEYDSNLLPGPVTNVPSDPAFYEAHRVRTFPRPTSSPASLATPPDRVTMRVRLVPVGLDVLDDLVASGDLDPSVRDAMPHFTLASTELEWTAEKATIKYPDQGIEVSCVTAGLKSGPSFAKPAPELTKCGP
jgi:hypothetical protein